VSHAMDLHHDGSIYGTITASEKNLFAGRSVRTKSHATREPMRIESALVQTAMTRELRSGIQKRLRETSLAKSRFQ